MAIYTYECENCGRIFDLSMKIEDMASETVCEICDGDAKKIIVPGHGGIQDDHPVWLDNSIRNQLQDTDSPETIPITTRKQYNKYLRDNGIVPTN